MESVVKSKWNQYGSDMEHRLFDTLWTRNEMDMKSKWNPYEINEGRYGIHNVMESI